MRNTTTYRQLADAQAGAVSRDQLRSLGLDRRAVDRRVRAGELEQRSPNVFRIVGCANTTALACWTAILDSDGVISHSSALGLFGVPGFQVKPIEVTRLRGGRRRPSQGHHRPTESGLESRLEHLARQAGVGGFVRQVDTGGEDIWLGRVDFRHCELPVVVFVDSERYHSALIDVRRDEEQRAALDAAGFVVVRVTDVDVWNRGPEVIAKLRGACERARAAELAVQIR